MLTERIVDDLENVENYVRDEWRKGKDFDDWTINELENLD